jgi:hypothetical protein
MTANAVQQATYSDLKVVKSRGQFQIILEAPLEQMARFVEMFGAPVPGAEIPVALARLIAPPAEPKERRAFHTLPLPQQAALCCADPRFREYLSVETEDTAAQAVREHCNVTSRAELATLVQAGKKWQGLLADFVSWKEHAGR